MLREPTISQRVFTKKYKAIPSLFYRYDWATTPNETC